jgi:beta-mannosidase
MTLRSYFYLSLALAILPMDAESQTRKPVQTFQVNGKWQFRQAQEQVWLDIDLPSSVHTALLKHGKIEDPFYRDNEAKTEWVETKDWEYEVTFDVPEQIMGQQHIDLKWAGLDTYAQVFLNDSLVLETNNMFRTWQTDVKKWLKPTGNILHVYFESPINKPKADWDALGYVLPGGIRTMTRKAQFHYGWDWGPKLTGCGIYKKPELVGWNDFIIDDLRVTVRRLEDDKAEMSAKFSYRSTKGGVVSTHLRHNNTKEILDVNIHAGAGEDSVIFTIKNPKLWWCRGMGEQYLYDVKLEVRRGYSVLDVAETRAGIRTVELVREKDKKGETFYVKLNGKPVFCKGANYIPLEVFQDRATPDKYETIVNHALDANMNMLRVWGGGIYEDDQFYKLCDEKGLMVWQDFMYACALYPANGSFLKNISAEAFEQITRLRKHPSVVLWCGNNENNEAWHHWGWQMNFTDEQRTRLWQHYKLIFNEILPTYVSNYADGVPYWESSPSYGRANQKSLTEGDAHDWGVWHDEAPFSRYETHVPRFMSEYGFQSFPEWSTIEKFSLPDERYLDSKVMMTHQKHPKGNQLIATYMKRSYQVPKAFKDFAYVSQILQAEGMRTGIEAHRRNKPYCMGSLYWQLNDVWPAASWSGIDYYGNWKALHYYARDAFSAVAAIPEINKDQFSIWLTADIPDSIDCSLQIKAMAFDGDSIFSKELTGIVVQNEASVKVWSESIKTILQGQKREESMVILYLKNAAGEVIHRRIVYLSEPKDMKLPSAKPKVSITNEGTEYTVKLQSDRLVKGVRLYLPKAKTYSDNYFDILPNEEKVIKIRTTEPVDMPESVLEMLYLNNI